MTRHIDLTDIQLHKLIKEKGITIGGNARLKIYGTLKCCSGKRMKKENRIFFKNETEALNEGFRPCGHCMWQQYLIWQKSFS